MRTWPAIGVATLVVVSFDSRIFAQPVDELSTEVVDARLSVVRNGAAPGGEELVADYEAARASLAQAESFGNVADEYLRTLTTAPAEEAAIRERLDAADDLLDIEPEIASLSPTELQTRLAVTRSELRETELRLSELDRQLATRESDVAAMRARSAEVSRRLDELPPATPIVDTSAMPSLTEARSWRLAAERAELGAELRMLEARLASVPARYSLMAAERTELSFTANTTRVTLRAMEDLATDIVTTDLRPETLGIDQSDPAYPVALALIERDEALKRELEQLSDRLDETREQLATIESHSRSLGESSSRAHRVVDFAAGSETLGRVLLSFWNDLDSFAVAPPPRRLSREVSRAVLRRIDYEAELAELARARSHVDRLLRDQGVEAATLEQSVADGLVDLVRGIRDDLREAITTESTYVEQLTALDVRYASLNRDIEDYSQYLESMMLWAPTRPTAWEADWSSLRAEYRESLAALASLELSPSINSILALLSVLALLYARTSIVARQRLLTEAAVPRPSGSLGQALLALLLVALRAVTVPALILAVALAIGSEGISVGARLSDSLSRFAAAFFALEGLRILCEPGGVGATFFGWRASVVEQAHAEIGWLTRRWLPLLALAVVTTALSYRNAGDALIARLALTAVMGMLIAHLLHGLIARARRPAELWYRGTINRGFIVVLIAACVIALGIILGRGIGVVVITSALATTGFIVLAFLILDGLLAAWLARPFRRSSVAQGPGPPHQDLPVAAAHESAGEDIAEESAHSHLRQTLGLALVGICFIVVFLVWRQWLGAFDSIVNFVLINSESVIDGETFVQRLTLGDLFAAVAVAWVTAVAARKLPPLLDLFLSTRTVISPGARYASRTILNYIVIGTGTVVALSLLGLEWSQLRWLVAALGVGLGFGLQEIVANFVSGLIILFERPIRVGDIVTIGTQSGEVTRIRIRATTIRDWDGKDLLVPNKEFITGQLVNWTLTDSHIRVVISVGVAYGSDVEKAIGLLSEAASEHPLVLTDPAPSVMFMSFADNALNLELRCFVADVRQRLIVLSELHRTINARLKAAGIVIAFPQRDVHVDSLGPLHVVLDKGEAT